MLPIHVAAAELAEEELLQSDSGSSSSDDENWSEAGQRLQQQQQGSDHLGVSDLDGRSTGSPSNNGAQDQLHDAAPQQQQQAVPAAVDAPLTSEGLFTSSELQQLSAMLGGTPPQQQQQQGATTAAAAAAAGGSVHFQRVNTKLDAFGTGLVDRLMAMEDAGEASKQICQQSLFGL
jgi:hypothetical protein